MDMERSRRQRDESAKDDVTEHLPGENPPASKRYHPDPSSRAPNVSVVEPSAASSASLTSPPPKYGCKVYWDDRYMKQFRQVSNVSSSSLALDHDETENSSCHPPEEEDDGKDTLPYHSWYFTYDELRPILLPLLLGGRDEVQALLSSPDGKHQELEDADVDGGPIATTEQPSSPRPNDTVPTISDHDVPSHNSDSDHEVDTEEEEIEEEEEVWEEVVEIDDDDDDDGLPQRDGLAKSGPVAILEIGCGDVPLGAALALEFKELETTTIRRENDEPPLTSLSIVSKIVCTDYSQVVVDMMRHQYRNMCCGTIEAISSSDTIVSLPTMRENKVPDGESFKVVNVGSVPLQFELTDARKLPYEDNSFHLVLEKGTLDAVLSDTVSGVSDCVQIVSECARVTSGCIVLISHLNAHTPSGLSWMEEVVFAGLRKSHGPKHAAVAWEVEVHGNADVTPEGDDDISVSRIPSGSPGPAVYIIHKKAIHESNADVGASAASRTSPINVQFFSYQ